MLGRAGQVTSIHERYSVKKRNHTKIFTFSKFLSELCDHKKNSLLNDGLIKQKRILLSGLVDVNFDPDSWVVVEL